jgi:hypothetical protein
MKKIYAILSLVLVLNFTAFSVNDPEVGQNYPNPATKITTIFVDFDGNEASLTIYTILGEKLKVIPIMEPGNITVDVSNLPAGVYMYTLNVDGVKVTKKMTVKKA